MLSRRSFCSCASLALASGLIPQSVSKALAEPAACDVMTPKLQEAVSHNEAVARLKAGNARFVSGHTVNCDLMRQVRETARKQAPFAAILGCIDSRVPPELVFDQRIGDVFCARIAGNFVNTDILGSLEFATKVEGARSIIVLGHSNCGAIKGAIDDVRLGNLTATLTHFRGALKATKTAGKRDSHNSEFVQHVAETNVRMTMKRMLKQSAVLSGLVAAGQLGIAGAMHDLETGTVTFLA